MNNRTKKTETTINVSKNAVKINCQFAETKTISHDLSYKINSCTLKDINARIENKVKKINDNKELTAEQKTVRIEKLTVENEVKSLVTMIENSLKKLHK
ncbi:MAG: hypothetical protein BWY67_00837 [Bacteroidetes bacterium ADurb.Bin397]|nr:MAG: hypothetical protein BWY67_00837 [Bacteroidetes bacterium ADurb.Bin397]